MRIETDQLLTSYNTLGLPALAKTLIRVTCESDLAAILEDKTYGRKPKQILGGGSNLVVTREIVEPVLKIEIMGRQIVSDDHRGWIVEAGAGEPWPELVKWTLDQQCAGLENLAMIPGTAGAAPVQNIGAYGVELKERFDSLDAVDLDTGRPFSLNREQCRFGYRDSIFKQSLAGKAVITRVRLRLPKPWQPVLEYPDLYRKCESLAAPRPDARQIFDWVCDLRRAKLPDPETLGNAGSFFKNPVVSASRYEALAKQEANLVAFAMPGGKVKLSAGYLIEQCGWKGKRIGNAGVYEKQALILVNHGGATGAEVIGLAAAIRKSVRQRFGISLEIEPTVV